jgi:hypothetical protein
MLTRGPPNSDPCYGRARLAKRPHAEVGTRRLASARPNADFVHPEIDCLLALLELIENERPFRNR